MGTCCCFFLLYALWFKLERGRVGERDDCSRIIPYSQHYSLGEDFFFPLVEKFSPLASWEQPSCQTLTTALMWSLTIGKELGGCCTGHSEEGRWLRVFSGQELLLTIYVLPGPKGWDLGCRPQTTGWEKPEKCFNQNLLGLLCFLFSLRLFGTASSHVAFALVFWEESSSGPPGTALCCMPTTSSLEPGEWDWDRMRGMLGRWGHAVGKTRKKHQAPEMVTSSKYFTVWCWSCGESKRPGSENSETFPGCFTLAPFPQLRGFCWGGPVDSFALHLFVTPALWVDYPYSWHAICDGPWFPVIVVVHGNAHFKWWRKDEMMIQSSNISHNDVLLSFWGLWQRMRQTRQDLCFAYLPKDML